MRDFEMVEGTIFSLYFPSRATVNHEVVDEPFDHLLPQRPPPTYPFCIQRFLDTYKAVRQSPQNYCRYAPYRLSL